MNQVCSKCGEEKECTAVNFVPDTRYPGKFKKQCRVCRRAAKNVWASMNMAKLVEDSRTYKRNNPEKTKTSAVKYYKNNKEKRKEYQKKWREDNQHYYLQYHYGMTVEDYSSLLLEQENRCAICRTDSKPLHVDHCHRSGKVRGLLCFNCNTALGKLQDNIKNFERAIEYLKK